MRGFLVLLGALLTITAAAQQVTLNPSKRLALEAKWMEIPASAFAALNLGTGITNEAGTNWVLSPEQTFQLVQTVRSITNASIVTSPRTLGFTRQDAHIAVQENAVIVTGIKSAATFPPGISAEGFDEVYETKSLPVGQWIDVLPELSPETSLFHLTVVAERTEMQGYDRISQNVTALVWVNSKRLELKTPLPRYITTRCFNVADVPNGSTLVFAGFKIVPSDAFAGPSPSAPAKVFLALITPTLLGSVEPPTTPGSQTKVVTSP